MDGERRWKHQQLNTVRRVVSSEFQLLYTNGYEAACALDARVKRDVLTTLILTGTKVTKQF
jgi:hypothetical protein